MATTQAPHSNGAAAHHKQSGHAAADDHDHAAGLGFATRTIHGGQRVCPSTGALMPPIYVSSTYAQSSPGVHQGFEYSRSHNPTRYALERCVASLEGTGLTEQDDASCGAFAFASGLAATATVLELLDAGEVVLCGDDVYGGTYRLLNRVRARSAALDVRRVDFADLKAAEAAICGGGEAAGNGSHGNGSSNGHGTTTNANAHKKKVGMVWLETPTNPTLKLADIPAIAALCRRANALLVVDNTFSTAALTRPLLLGADVVVSSSTKYLNGHSDSVGGVAATRRLELARRLRFLQNAVGAVMAPFDSYLTLRGCKTLHVRVSRHCSNAAEIARRLEGSEGVLKVAYPGLESHPQHGLACRQMRLACSSVAKGGGGGKSGSGEQQERQEPSEPAFGGMIAVTLAGGLAEARAFLSSLKLFALAESLGGVESLAEHPAIMTHASVPAEERAALGIDDGFVRLSVGIEHVEDLWRDLERGLQAARAVATSGAGAGAGGEKGAAA
jgi:cystathionine gamma-lyase